MELLTLYTIDPKAAAVAGARPLKVEIDKTLASANPMYLDLQIQDSIIVKSGCFLLTSKITSTRFHSVTEIVILSRRWKDFDSWRKER